MEEMEIPTRINRDYLIFCEFKQGAINRLMESNRIKEKYFPTPKKVKDFTGLNIHIAQDISYYMGEGEGLLRAARYYAMCHNVHKENYDININFRFVNGEWISNDPR
jgi:hypothetical protein